MANQIDNLAIIDLSTGITRTPIASDDLFLSVDLTLNGGAQVVADNFKRGSGDPNGSVTGNEGDLYARTDASTGRLYVNTDGTVTGWEEALIPSTLIRPGVNSVVLLSGSTATSYATIATALAAAVAGDTVVLGVGSYAESITVPASVHLEGAWSGGVSHITGSVATGTRITLNDSSSLAKVRVTLPTDATSAVVYAGTGTATINDITMVGGGGSGRGIENSGTGVLRTFRGKYIFGTAACVFYVTSGEMCVLDCVLEDGTLDDAILATGGLLRFRNFAACSTTLTYTDGLEIGAATVLGNDLTLRGPTNAVHITNNAASIQIRGGTLDGDPYDLLVDPGVTTGTIHAIGFEASRNKFSAPGAFLENATLVITYQDEVEGDEAFRFISEIAVGTPEKGRESVFGEGDSYTTGMVVFTTDSTASPTVDGGNLTSVTTEAGSPTGGSTFSFQGSTANHAILIGSARSNASDSLKHWGLKVSNTIAASGGSFVFEIWDGAVWVEIGAMATHSSLFHRYANTFFQRANNSEHIRFGIEDSTTWATKTIGGIPAYWSRIRIETAATTVPVFEQFKLSTNRTELNADGTKTDHGRARSRKTIVTTGNVFGESGGVSSTTISVGTGGVPTGWDHNIKNSMLNGVGDAIYFQFNLPRGIDTSFPLRLALTYRQNVVTSPVQMIWSFYGAETTGVLIADPAGGVTPVARTDANATTINSVAAQTATFTLPESSIDKAHLVRTSGFDLTERYEGDLCFVRLELDDDGPGAANIFVLSLEIDAVFWTPGEKI